MTSTQILMVAYFFPPLGGAGVQRTVKFVKYLPSYGWDPVVLTVAHGTHIAYDRSLMADLPPSLPVYRSRAFDPEDLGGWWRGPREEAETGESKFPASSGMGKAETVTSEGKRRRWQSHIVHFYLRMIPWVCVPDRKVGWLPYAVRMGRQICMERPIQALFSTSSPITSHLIAMRLKRLYGIPWVADFRDLWVSFPGHTAVTGMHRRIERRIERNILTHADRVIANTGAARRVLLEDYPFLKPDHVVTILNGYDEDDFKNLPTRSPHRRFTLTYTGNFYGNRNPQTLFRALTQLFTRRADLRGAFTIRLIGPYDPRIDGWIQTFRLQETVEVLPYQPHRQSLEALALSDAMLLIDAPGFTVNIPGKVFEYLRIGRPILALTPPGATADLLRETGGAIVVHPDHIEGIMDALLHLYTSQDRESTGLRPDPAVVTRYERRELTARLAGVFDQVRTIRNG